MSYKSNMVGMAIDISGVYERAKKNGASEAAAWREVAEYCLRNSSEVYKAGIESATSKEFVQHNKHRINKSLQELGLIP